LALEPLGKGALGAVTAVLLESLTAGRNMRQVVLTFLRGVNATLRLLPLELSVVKRQVDTFLQIKGIDLGDQRG
jgi:hypothetical protein